MSGEQCPAILGKGHLSHIDFPVEVNENERCWIVPCGHQLSKVSCPIKNNGIGLKCDSYENKTPFMHVFTQKKSGLLCSLSPEHFYKCSKAGNHVCNLPDVCGCHVV